VTVQHAIIAFPTLRLSDRVESIRRRFDPLATLLGAHVTLVFPFADESIEPRLDQHIAQAIAGVAPFDFGLTVPTAGDGGYLFLNVTAGAGHFVQLHERLYTGVLAPHRSPTHSYIPHITIGRLANADLLLTAAAEARSLLDETLVGRVDKLAVFRLDDPLRGAVTSTVSLGR
jgi:2'-5' RNA ligase